MKYDSYPFLISTIVGAVVLIFGFVTWRRSRCSLQR
jgi:hypothetical protein